MIILVPLFIVIVLFIWSGLAHLCLMIVGGANQSFETTFRVFAFTQGSTGPLQIIPLCGGLISGSLGDRVQLHRVGARSGNRHWPRRFGRFSSANSLLRRRILIAVYVWCLGAWTASHH